MSHPSPRSRIGDPFIELFTIDSTNNYAMARAHEGLARHGMVITAKHQTAGKGQRNKQWVVEPGANITMSCVLEPQPANETRPFLLSAAIALACRDLVDEFTKGDCTIKWPNDIYWRDRKAGGILIENIYKGSRWAFAIAGIGLNINQTTFPEDLPNPVSLKQITGQHFDRDELIRRLCGLIEQRYDQFTLNDPALIKEYNEQLFAANNLVRFKKENVIFKAAVTGVSEAGELICFDSMERRFQFGEVEWLL